MTNDEWVLRHNRVGDVKCEKSVTLIRESDTAPHLVSIEKPDLIGNNYLT